MKPLDLYIGFGGVRVIHSARGIGFIDDAAKELQKTNPDSTSIFVTFDGPHGETLEVTKALVKPFPYAQ